MNAFGKWSRFARVQDLEVGDVVFVAPFGDHPSNGWLIAYTGVVNRISDRGIRVDSTGKEDHTFFDLDGVCRAGHFNGVIRIEWIAVKTRGIE